nr:hypothetical protein [Tanacetum cinerariifolium]
MGCAEAIEEMLEIKVYEMGGDEEIFTSEAWRQISSENELVISRSSAGTFKKPILKVLQKMITYGLCQRTNGYDKVTQEKKSWKSNCCGHFITKIARRANLLIDDVLNGLIAPIYCRSLDTTTLRELIDSNRRLIAEEPTPGDPRVDVLPHSSSGEIAKAQTGVVK